MSIKLSSVFVQSCWSTFKDAACGVAGIYCFMQGSDSVINPVNEVDAVTETPVVRWSHGGCERGIVCFCTVTAEESNKAGFKCQDFYAAEVFLFSDAATSVFITFQRQTLYFLELFIWRTYFI